MAFGAKKPRGGRRQRQPAADVPLLFAEEDGKTRMDMTLALTTPEAAAEEPAKRLQVAFTA